MRARPVTACFAWTLIVITSFAGPAAAAEVETVQLRGLGGNPTDGFPADLLLRITSPDGWTDAECCEDSNSGEWDGPTYQGPSTTGTAQMVWSVTAKTSADDVESAVLGLVSGNPVDDGYRSLPVVRNGQVVDSVAAYWIITRCDHSSTCASHESAIGFYVANGVYVVANFTIFFPSDDSSFVGNQSGAQFNEATVRGALGGVEIVGTLPLSGRTDGELFEGSKLSDTMRLGGGSDYAFGGAGNDKMFGEGGADKLDGDAGNDTINGGGGNDRIYADLGADSVLGGEGDDKLAGGPGTDVLNGGPGKDTCYFDTRAEKRGFKSCEFVVKGNGVGVLGGNRLVAQDPLLLDLLGDGIDISGSTTTSLLSGKSQNIRWTKANTDDAFFVVDATSLRTAGFDMQDSTGDQMDDITFGTDGASVIDPSGARYVINDAFQLLAALDANRDGKLSDADSTWTHVKVFVDANADGLIAPGEVETMPEAGVRDISTAGTGGSRVDAFGNTMRDGTFSRTDGSSGQAQDVFFAQA